MPAVVLTISDGVTAGTRIDESGERLAERLADLGFSVTRAVTADEPDEVAAVVRRAADGGARFVVTTGGTGLGPRDRTPEAMSRVVDYVVPGFGEAMRSIGRESTPLASLSRSLGGVRGRTLILALPGSPRGALESLAAVEELLEHSLEMLAGRTAHAPDPGPAPGSGPARGSGPTPGSEPV
jgi:molybdenum cofactor synthesis domain-containing protein